MWVWGGEGFRLLGSVGFRVWGGGLRFLGSVEFRVWGGGLRLFGFSGV